jgi:hypothetical protein
MISKGSTRDISMGPLSNRSCTDILFMLIFLAALVLYAAVAYLSFNQGDPGRYVTFRNFFIQILDSLQVLITGARCVAMKARNRL